MAKYKDGWYWATPRRKDGEPEPIQIKNGMVNETIWEVGTFIPPPQSPPRDALPFVPTGTELSMNWQSPETIVCRCGTTMRVKIEIEPSEKAGK